MWTRSARRTSRRIARRARGENTTNGTPNRSSSPFQPRIRTVRTPSSSRTPRGRVSALVSTLTDQPRSRSPWVCAATTVSSPPMWGETWLETCRTRGLLEAASDGVTAGSMPPRNQPDTSALFGCPRPGRASRGKPVTSDAPEQRARWYRRVLPVTGLLLAIGGVLVQVFPGVRDQVALSATHRQQEYVALSFGRAADGTVLECAGSRRTVKVRFAVDSHLMHDRALTYRLTVGKAERK